MTQIFPKLEQEFLQTGKASLLIQPFPLNDIDLKIDQIIYGSKKPCECRKIIYESQHLWIKDPNPLEAVTRVLVLSGIMNREEINRSIKNKRFETRITELSFDATKKYNIEGVPVFIIGSQEIIGLTSWKEFRSFIVKALNHVNSGNPLESFGKK